jgi:hypothetical protein
MTRAYLSIGRGGPRVGMVASGRGLLRGFLTLAIPFGLLGLAGNVMDKSGSGLLGFMAAGALAALMWYAWTRPPWDPKSGKPPPR